MSPVSTEVYSQPGDARPVTQLPDLELTNNTTEPLILSEATLRLTEIFYSLQGESRTVGLPTVFVRLTGCPMRCVYCDTSYAFQGGSQHTLVQVLDQVAGYSPRYVTVTGGEPLAQKQCWPLLKALNNAGYAVSLETGGAISTADVDPRTSIVLDIKTPASGELHRNDWGNIARLTANDQLKFVIVDKADYEWARFKLEELDLAVKVSEVLFSPCHGELDPKQLAEWIIDDNLPVRMQLQMHKYLWGDRPGH